MRRSPSTTTRTETVQKNETIIISQEPDETVQGNETIIVGMTRALRRLG